MGCATALGFGSFGAVEGIWFAAGGWEVGTPSFLLSYTPVLLTHGKAGCSWGRDTRSQPQAAPTLRALGNAQSEIHVSHLPAELICLSKSIPTLMVFIRNFSSFEHVKGESSAIEKRPPPTHGWILYSPCYFVALGKKASEGFLKHRVSCTVEGKGFFWWMQFNCATKPRGAELPSPGSLQSTGHTGPFSALQTALPCVQLSNPILATF